jgi:hypothetical protein
MTHVTSNVRLVCLAVIAALFFGAMPSGWAQDEEPEYRDPTIVEEESSSVPDGVKNLASEEAAKKKEIVKPIYGEWWFWATTVATAGAWLAISMIPMHKKALMCNTNAAKGTTYPLGCIGDGR